MPSVDEQLREAREGARGSGRTHRMIMALPDNAIVIVPNFAMVTHIRGMIDRLRNSLAERGVVVSDVRYLRYLEGLESFGRPIFVDHSFWEIASAQLCQRAEALLRRQVEPESISDASRYSMSLTPGRNMYGHHGGTRFMTPASIGHNAGRRAARIFGQTFDGPEAEDL